MHFSNLTVLGCCFLSSAIASRLEESQKINVGKRLIMKDGDYYDFVNFRDRIGDFYHVEKAKVSFKSCSFANGFENLEKVVGLLLASNSEEHFGLKFKESPYSPQMAGFYLGSLEEFEKNEKEVYERALESYFYQDIELLKNHPAVKKYLQDRKEFTEKIFNVEATVTSQVGGMIAAKGIFSSTLHHLLQVKNNDQAEIKLFEAFNETVLNRKKFALLGCFFYSLTPNGEFNLPEVRKLVGEAAKIEMSLIEGIMPESSLRTYLLDTIKYSTAQYALEAEGLYLRRREQISS